MTQTTRFEQEIGPSFLAALVLTGSARDAESALMEAIESLQPESDGSILRLSMVAALRLAGVPRRASEECPLPHELRRLFRLPTDQRRCFAMRILAGIPREQCAELLCLSAEALDKLAGAGARELARISAIDAGTRTTAATFSPEPGIVTAEVS